MIVTIPLKQIYPNPYQTRQSEDPEHIQKLAFSIAENGLLQIPSARYSPPDWKIDVQLAFGHSRAAAYRLLDQVQRDLEAGRAIEFEEDSLLAQVVVAADQQLELGTRFDTMPLNIVELDDQEMFEQAVIENHERKNLSPIEEARAMQVYRDQFKKTSSDIGKLFHLSESAVRNKMRLLDLPENAQDQVGSGQVTEGAARALLTMKRLAPEETVNQVAKKIAGENLSPKEVEEKIRENLSSVKGAKEMWGRWQSGNPCGGTGLWPLNWTPEELPVPKFADFQKIYTGPDTFQIHWARQKNHLTRGINMPDVETWNLKTLYGNSTIPSWRQSHESLIDGAQAFFDLLDQLIKPPACTSCLVYARLNGTHWCGQKECWLRKREAWYQQELQKAHEKTGIQIYDKSNDGTLFEEANSWGERQKQFKQWVDEKDPYLRLRIHYQDYNPNVFTDSHCVQVISIHPSVIAKIQEEKEKEKNREGEEENRRQLWKVQAQNREAADRFIIKVAAPRFAQILEPIKSLGFWIWLADTSTSFDPLKEHKDQMKVAKGAVMEKWLSNALGWSLREKGPVEVAKHLQGVATTWGITLPDDWLDQAKKFEPSQKDGQS